MTALENFQDFMKKYGYTAYVIPTSDDHNSEYIPDYFKAREFLTGFTGSQGTLVILQKSAYLWVDGRYYIQAEKQVGNNIAIMKMGQPNVPTVAEFLSSILKDKDTLAFEGKMTSAAMMLEIISKLKAGIVIKPDAELISLIWPQRPQLPFSILYKLESFFCGKSYWEKLQDIHKAMKENNAEYYILSALEDQAWLYNLRANDILHTPVFLAFTVITPEHTFLFIDPNKIDLTIEKYLDDNDIIVKQYNDIYEYVKALKDKKVMMDLSKINYAIYSSADHDNKVIPITDPTLALKAKKNETEIHNLKLAHIKDGVCVAKFMHYLKKQYELGNPLDEISLGQYMDNLRAETEGYVDLSFTTICAFKENAAMMHYSATPKTNKKLDGPGLLLIDSGGHYLEGSTDITRTYALGNIPDELKEYYTLVLKSMIALSQAVFLKGCTGQNLDILARGPIWKRMMDYKCGTGHGVGYLLGVHEAPNGFRWKIVPERNDSAPFVPGMVTTNEPGLYVENNFGVRIENEMLCLEKGETVYGEFLGFETITYAPIDLDAIKYDMLLPDEIEWLNNYHDMVYKKIHHYLTPEEDEFLQYYTRHI